MGMRRWLTVMNATEWQLGMMDVKAAYLQAKGFEREIYVRPPKEEQQPDALWN